MVFLFRGRRRNFRCSVLLLALLILALYSFAAYTARQTAVHQRVSSSACGDERRHILYVKMIKCASTTLVSIFRRFGAARNLSFLLPVGKRIYVGWPYPVRSTFYRPSRDGLYDMLTEHAVYQHDALTTLFRRPPAIITSVREPLAQFRSMYKYYNLAQIAAVGGDGSPDVYLRNLSQYEGRYMSTSAAPLRHCVPDGFSMSKNLMAFNLGYDRRLDAVANRSRVGDWLADIDRHFTLIIVVEHFVESLVLLRRLLCWTHDDVTFLRQNVAEYSSRERAANPETEAIYRRWSDVDYALYDYANRTLWTRIRRQGSDFWDEVRHFQAVLRNVTLFCQTGRDRETVYVAASKWSRDFHVNRRNCTALAKDLLPRLKARYDAALGARLLQPIPAKTFC